MGPVRLVLSTGQGTEDVCGGVGTLTGGPPGFAAGKDQSLSPTLPSTMMGGRLLRSELTLMEKVTRISLFPAQETQSSILSLRCKCEQKTENHQTLKEKPFKENPSRYNKLKNSLKETASIENKDNLKLNMKTR